MFETGLEMKQWILWFCWGVLLLGAGGAHAQVDRATAESLMKKSGMWEQLGSIALQADASLAGVMRQSGEQPSAEEVARISRVIRDAYSADRLRSVSVALIAKKLQARHVSELQRWFDSPLGQQISRLEEQASADSSDPQQQMQQGMALLEQQPPARRQLLQELLVETQVVEAMTQITINTSLAAYSGAASVIPQAPTMSARELKAALEAQRPRLAQGFTAMALAGFAKTYDTLSTDHLQRYVAFMKSAAGHHYNALGIEALDAALIEAAAELGRKLPSTRDQART